MAEECIILAFSNEQVGGKISRMLSAGGIQVQSICHSGAEVSRKILQTESALVITSFKLGDITAELLYDDLPDTCRMLVIGKAQQKEMIQNDRIVFMPLPLNKDELCRAVEMIIGGVYRRGKPAARTEEEQKIIEQAKLFLSEHYMMSEAQAHRFIQKRSMDTGARFVDTARMILG